MQRCALSVLLLAVAATTAPAHFIWIVPEGTDGTTARVIFSDSLEPDDAVPIEKIAATRLLVREGTGKGVALDWKKAEHRYLVRVPGQGPVTLGGICRYGVLQRGEGKPFFLAYYPKYIRGPVEASKPWEELPCEIVPQGSGRFRVLYAGKPAPDAEVVAVTPGRKENQTLRTDAQGEFTLPLASPGLYAVRARHIESKAGEHDGKKYEEARHYATLVFRVPDAPPKNAPRSQAAADVPTYPPLPRAVSSFGAAVADGWVYVYGGHCARTHQYSTEAVLGTFHRLKLSDPATWEELPPGPAVQGLALVAHQGKVYRIGGMQPRNPPGERADNHSLASCTRFDPATGRWEALPDLPEGRSSHDAVVAGDKLIVVGGWNMHGAGKKTDWHSTGLILDLKKQPLQWRPVQQPFQRRALTAAVHAGRVYVLGGMTPDGTIERTVNVYDPAQDAWTTAPEIPGPQRNGFAPAAADAGGRLYVSGADGLLFRLAASGTAWEEVGRLQQPRIVHRLVPAKPNLLVALGGAAKGTNVALTEALTPSRAGANAEPPAAPGGTSRP